MLTAAFHLVQIQRRLMVEDAKMLIQCEINPVEDLR